MLNPSQIPVRPRVIAEQSRETVLLEDLVEELLSAGDVSVLRINGTRGSGLTTALSYLQDRFGSQAGLRFTEEASMLPWPSRSRSLWIGFPLTNSSVGRILRCEMAGWGQDELIEYLLAMHRDRCASVMRRLHHDPRTASLKGNPNLWSQVLELFAEDEGLLDLKAALVRVIEKQFPDIEYRQQLQRLCFQAAIDEKLPGIMELTNQLSTEQEKLFHIPAIVSIFATAGGWRELQDIEGHACQKMWPRQLIEEVAPHVRGSVAIQDKLRSRLTSRTRLAHPLAVSFLHAAGQSWHDLPTRFFNLFPTSFNLEEAILDGGDCSEMRLMRSKMNYGSFSDVRFSSADLHRVTASHARFNRAHFRNAKLSRFDATGGSFIGADLTNARGSRVVMDKTDLSGADLSHAQFMKASFRDSRLHGTKFCHAELVKCNFIGADLKGADFTGANLEGACMWNADLRVADFSRASFQRAQLSQCKFEGMELPDADFYAAVLNCALLTESTMPRANFSAADLKGAKLAHIEWEFANLQGADLTGATFHMGSTRSGLVGSSIPMYGSRTGFYTDEYHEQDFRAPEEIRKANLRGADLRGAVIHGVDFYLVDLRDALFDPEQEDQLRRTGAILLAPA
ncbi:MAG: pentapeptide repeat protein [Schlesneria sp.]|nr:pentapeptide repeat protein [Schlesneria sp.]